MESELLKLDREWIANLCFNGVSFLKELLAIFQKQGDGYIALLNGTEVLSKNIELADETHRLKGSASSLGLCQLAALLSDFEHALRDGKESEAELKQKRLALVGEVQTGERLVEQYIVEIDNKK